MKILTGIDIPFLPSSGSPIICNDWYSNLPPDIEVRFLTLPPNNAKYDNWWSIEDVVFLDIEKKKSIEEFPQYVQTLKQEVEKQIKDFEPDIIHCQHLNFGLSMAIAELDDYPMPKIGICHGTDVQLATQSEFFLNNLKLIRSKMDLLLFPTQNMANDYFKYDPCQKDYVVVSHGIPDEAYSQNTTPPTLDWTERPFKILYAGRLTSFKGADIAVLATRHISEDVRLTVIGDEDESGYKQKLLEDVEKYNLQNKVSFVDSLTRRQLWQEFSHFDLIVFPSTELECFSLTTVEAQLQGLVVAYHENAGGIENVVGDSGIKIAENTPQKWAEKIKEIYDNRSIISHYRDLGYENAKKYRFSTIKDEFFQISRDFLALSIQGVQKKASFLEAGRRFTKIWKQEQENWQSGNVVATNMKNGSIVPIDYCLSTIARVQEQSQVPTKQIEIVRNKLEQFASQQFIYPWKSIHISLQGCTERLPSQQDFTDETILKVEQACTEILTGISSVDILLRGVNILGSQVFIQGFPYDDKWAELRQQLETAMIRIGEKPIIYTDKKPIHMNIMRITDNSQEQLDQILAIVEELRDVEIGKFQVSTIEFLMTDFVVSPAQIKIFKKFHLQ